jgi:hypothetical protein
MKAMVDLTAKFTNIFERLLARENLADHEKELSGLFERIAQNLVGGSPDYSGCYFDGAGWMIATIHPPRRVEFRGEMWVGRNTNQWREPFHAKVVDKRSTRQGLWITLSVGKNRGEGETSAALQKPGTGR